MLRLWGPVVSFVILSGLPMFGASAVPSSSDVVIAEVTVTGMQTGLSFVPFATSARIEAGGFSTHVPRGPDTNCRNANCAVPNAIPANEWLSVRVRVETQDGSPVPGEAVSLMAFYGRGTREGDAGGRTGPSGEVTLLLPPTRPGDEMFDLQVRDLHRNSVALTYAVHGVIPPDPRERFIAPNDGWIEVEVVPTRTAFFYWDVNGVHMGASPDGPQAYMMLYEITNTTRRHGGAWASFGDVHGDFSAGLAVGSLNQQVELDTPLREGASGAGLRNTLQGFYGPDLRIRVLLARAGLDADLDRGFRLFADPDAYEINIIRQGRFRATGGTISAPTSVGAYYSGLGPTLGNYAAHDTVGADDATVVAIVGTGEFSGGRAIIKRDAARIEGKLSGYDAFFFAGTGACGGDWSAAFTGSSLLWTPGAMIAVAEGLVLSEQDARRLGAQQDCDL